VGQAVSGALAGTTSVDAALTSANTAANRDMRRAGFLK